MSEDKLQLITPFGPCIAKVKIPEKIIKTLNDHVDKTRASKKMSEKQFLEFLVFMGSFYEASLENLKILLQDLVEFHK